MTNRAITGSVLLSTLLMGACASGSYANNEFQHGALRYRTGSLSAQWRRIRVDEANLTFRHAQGGAILANATCGDQIDDVPLDVLTNHLLFGVERVKEIARGPFTLDGRGALRTQLYGELDGVPIEMDLVVLKKDRCTFDFQLVAGTSEIAARRPEFEAFFKGFAALGTPR